VTRTSSSSSSALWDTRGLTAAQAADLHAALSSLPKSFSSQLSQYAQLSSLPQFGSNQFGLQQPSYSSKERSAVLSHDRDILSRDRDIYSRDREYYNSKNLYDSLYSQAGPQSQMLVGGSQYASQHTGAGGGFNSSKYSQLLAVIEEIGKDIRPTYAGNKSSAERLKRGIVHARILVREALMEAERSARQ